MNCKECNSPEVHVEQNALRMRRRAPWLFMDEVGIIIGRGCAAADQCRLGRCFSPAPVFLHCARPSYRIDRCVLCVTSVSVKGGQSPRATSSTPVRQSPNAPAGIPSPANARHRLGARWSKSDASCRLLLSHLAVRARHFGWLPELRHVAHRSALSRCVPGFHPGFRADGEIEEPRQVSNTGFSTRPLDHPQTRSEFANNVSAGRWNKAEINSLADSGTEEMSSSRAFRQSASGFPRK